METGRKPVAQGGDNSVNRGEDLHPSIRSSQQISRDLIETKEDQYYGLRSNLHQGQNVLVFVLFFFHLPMIGLNRFNIAARCPQNLPQSLLTTAMLPVSSLQRSFDINNKLIWTVIEVQLEFNHLLFTPPGQNEEAWLGTRLLDCFCKKKKKL